MTIQVLSKKPVFDIRNLDATEYTFEIEAGDATVRGTLKLPDDIDVEAQSLEELCDRYGERK